MDCVAPGVPTAVTRRSATEQAVAVALETPTSTRRGRTPAPDIRPPIGSVVEPAPVVRHDAENRAIRDRLPVLGGAGHDEYRNLLRGGGGKLETDDQVLAGAPRVRPRACRRD